MFKVMRGSLKEAVQQQYPFVTELDSPDLYGTDIDVIIAHDRYGVNPVSYTHLWQTPWNLWMWMFEYRRPSP